MTVVSAEPRPIKRAKNLGGETSYPGARSRVHGGERSGSTQRGMLVLPRSVIMPASVMPQHH
jgi:hypothetical protein